MHPRFLAVTESLDQKLAQLLDCPPLRFGQLPVRMATSGVYLFTEQGRYLYVGRSNRLRKRYFLHCRPGSQQNQASFGYKIAREALSIGGASYAAGPLSRKGLAATDSFSAEFLRAKARIRDMDYRFIEETDQARQSLLEAYCAIVLDTPYNDFDTH